MKVTVVYIEVKPEFVDAFKKITVYNHENSVKEPGNIRFDVLQCADEPTKFALYEAFESEEALAFHKETEHYKKWAAEITKYVTAPRTRTVYQTVAFTGEKE